MTNNAKHSDAFLMILDSNLKFQSLALLLNILETQSPEVRVVIFYVYDDNADLQEYFQLVNETILMFGFEHQKDLVEVKFISTEIADELTKSLKPRFAPWLKNPSHNPPSKRSTPSWMPAPT